MERAALLEIRSALTDLHRAVSAIAKQVNAHSVAEELSGVEQAIRHLNRTLEKQPATNPTHPTKDTP